jgi:hypothetical protein
MISREHMFIIAAFLIVALIVVFHRRKETAIVHGAASADEKVSCSVAPGGTGGYAYAAANVSYLYPPCLAAVLPVAAH